MPQGLNPDLMRVVGGLLRSAVSGTLQLMKVRATAKHELRAQVTMIQARNNNPLKFSPDARSALELGLINAVHPRENLDQVLAERAAALAAKAPQALLATKELLKGAAYRSQVAAKIEEERVEFERRLSSPEAREIMSAFLEKRPVDPSRLL